MTAGLAVDPPPARRVVHLLLGHALGDEARRALRLVLRVAIRPTTSSLIRCAGSRRPSRPGRCCEEVRCHASGRACGS